MSIHGFYICVCNITIIFIIDLDVTVISRVSHIPGDGSGHTGYGYLDVLRCAIHSSIGGEVWSVHICYPGSILIRVQCPFAFTIVWDRSGGSGARNVGFIVYPVCINLAYVFCKNPKVIGCGSGSVPGEVHGRAVGLNFSFQVLRHIIVRRKREGSGYGSGNGVTLGVNRRKAIINVYISRAGVVECFG